MMNFIDGGHSKNATDAGLLSLVTRLRFLGIGADPEQIRHRFGGTPIGIAEMLRVAPEFNGRACPIPRSRRLQHSRTAATTRPCGCVSVASCHAGGSSMALKPGRSVAGSAPLMAAS